MEILHESLTSEIIGAAFEVHNHLGYGFLEKVYQNAMEVELGLRRVPFSSEAAIKVNFKDKIVGSYFADLFVDQKVIVELKVAKDYNPADEAQLLNQLKATGIKVGLLINFGREKVAFKRMVM